MPTPTIIHGFNNLPVPELTIRETGYDMRNGNAHAEEYGMSLATTPAEVQAVIDANPGLGWETNAQYAYYDITEGEPPIPGEEVPLELLFTFPNMATDGTNDYSISLFINRICIIPEGYTCGIIPLARVTADGHFEIMGGRVSTTEQGVKYIAAKDFLEISYFMESDEDWPRDLSFLITLNDLDTGDKYAETAGEADRHGNNYHGAQDDVWPYQEAWGIALNTMPSTVYVSNNSWLVNDEVEIEGMSALMFGNGHSTDCDGDECSLVYLAEGEDETIAYGVFTTSTGSLRLFSSLATPGVSYTIVASADDGGSISDEGSTTVEEGGCMTYTITPDEGYQVGQIIVDGQLVGYNMTEYSFCPVHADHTIHVTFIDDDIAPCSVEAPEIDVPPIDPLTAEEEFVDELPESGEANTVYYVTDGEGYDIYYWDGTKFVQIA